MTEHASKVPKPQDRKLRKDQQPPEQRQDDIVADFNDPWDMMRGIAASPGDDPPDPNSFKPHQILQLQRTIGNRRTIQLLRHQDPTIKTSRIIQRSIDKPVSAQVMKRLEYAQQAIKYTTEIFKYGAGNQEIHLRETKWNAWNRRSVVRTDKYWKLTEEAEKLAAIYPWALTAAKAERVKGGNCAEYAKVAFGYLRFYAKGEQIRTASKENFDHQFVIIGDFNKDDEEELVVADAWPTKPTAVRWVDSIGYEQKDFVTIYDTAKGGEKEDVVPLIRDGLTLTNEGQELVEKELTKEETEEEINKGKKGSESEKAWIFNQVNSYHGNKDFNYVDAREYEDDNDSDDNYDDNEYLDYESDD